MYRISRGGLVSYTQTHTHAHKSLIMLIIICTEEAHLDPNDPRNFELLQLAEVINTHHTLEITGTLALSKG